MVFISWITRIGGSKGRKRSDPEMNQGAGTVPEDTVHDLGHLIGVRNGHTRGKSVGGTVGMDDENENTPMNSVRLVPNPENEPKGGCVNYLKMNGYWEILMETIRFTVHFFLVMLLLFLGAMAFVWLEDPEPKPLPGISPGNNTLQNDTVKKSIFTNETFWNRVVTRYNLTVDANLRVVLMDEFREFIIEEEKRKAETPEPVEQKDRKFVFLKWFYFVTIATTTIGYGDISPQTDNGKLFYIFFSVVGIGLMMTLLKECGSVISAANTKCYALIDRYVCRGKNCVSNELLTSISISLIFAVYLYAGIYFGREIVKNDWSIIDHCYYWIVTFTTVGFGDILNPLEKEIEHIYFYVIYRIFGLAFLAAIIDALAAYAEKRKEYFQQKQQQFRDRMQAMPGVPGPTSRL